MKARFLTAILISGVLFVTASECYAWVSPVAVLTDYPDPVVDGCSVTLDGCLSYDPDGYITQWCFSWDWDSNPIWNSCSTTSCKTTHIYPGPGTYHARLRVKDNQSRYGYAYTWVHVGEVTPELTKGPYLIYGGNNTEMMVLWQLNGDANCTLKWGPDPNCDADSVLTSEYGMDHQHGYIISDVDTATKYYYRVEVPDDANYSGSFRTAPDADATGVKFLAYGDTRAKEGETEPVDHNEVCAQMINTYTGDPNYQTFTLHSGDWVWNGNTESYWADTHFNRSYPNLIEMQANLPIQGCTGNHEVDAGFAIAFEKYLPYLYEPDGRYWSFDYGPAHVVVVDQYNEGNEGVVDANQLEWIENDLAGTAKKWKFIVLHEPGYSAGGGHDDNTDVQDNIQPLCESYGVDIVFAGHNHYYARCDVNGVKHITTGGGGAELATPDPYYSDYVEECHSVHHFCKIAVNDLQLNFEAVDVSGAVIDSFTLTRRRWYVNSAVSGGNDDGTSWENAFDDLQEALDVVLYGDEIWVAEGEGTYKPSKQTDPNDSRTATFQLVNGVAMYGGFDGTETSRSQRNWNTHETILSGDIGTIDDASDNCYHVVIGAGNSDTVIDGFTITGGNANDGTSHNALAGGMYNNTNINSNSSPTVTNCIFSGNSAKWGGGMYNIHSSNPTLTNCIFSENIADPYGGGGMGNQDNSSPTLTNCTFSNNSANYAGGIFNDSESNPTLTNCVFSKNAANGSYGAGGGMINQHCNSPTLTNCIFTGNTATGGQGDGGGMYDFDSNSKLTNCLFIVNDADDNGGGMYLTSDSNPTLVNCTFVGNSAEDYGGGMYHYSGLCNSMLTNCILWGNTPEQIGGSAVVTYSDVQGGWSGISNIDEDPFFASVGDYHLLPNSPCINKGDPDGSYSGQMDIDGDPRVMGGRVDMGADEVELATIYINVEDAGNGQVKISYTTENGASLRSIALKVELSDGATINSDADVVSCDSSYNCFMDYAFSIGASYTLGTGHPLADAFAPGVPDFSGGGISEFSINMASFDESGNQTSGPASSSNLITLQLNGATGTSTTVTVSEDTLRSSFSTRGLATNLPQTTTVTLP